MSDDLATIGYAADMRGINKINKGLGSVAKTGEKTEKRMAKSANGISSSFRIAGAAVAAIAGSKAISEVISYSDSWAKLNNSLRLVVNSELELVDVRTKLLRISNDTSAGVENTADLYAELYRNTRDLNKSQTEVMSVTKTINNLFKAGGKSASETAGAVRQLNQGLAAGALRGDEFNSVAEGAPKILDALSSSLNMSKGELREFAATGGITAKLLFNSLSSYSEDAQKLADKTTKTFSQMMVESNTNATEFVGTNKSLSTATNTLGESILFLSSNIDNLLTSLAYGTSVYAAFATLQGGKVLYSTLTSTAAINAYTTSVGRAALATKALGAATKFMTGPWGLLATAVGVAATAFIVSKDASDDLTKSLEEQKKEVNRLHDIYKAMGNTKFGENAVATQKELIELDTKVLAAEEKISKARLSVRGSAMGASSSSTMADLGLAKRELDELIARRSKVQSLFDATVSFFNGNIPDKWQTVSVATNKASKAALKAADAYQKWIESVNDAANPTAKLSQEIERINKAMSKGDISLSIGAIRVQQLRDEINEMNVTPMDEWISATIAAADPTRAIYEEIARVNEAMKGGSISSKVGVKRLEQLGDALGDGKNTDIGNPFESMTNGAMDAMSAMSQMFESGTNEANALSIAMQSVAIGSSIMSGNMLGAAAAGIGLLVSMDKIFNTQIKDISKDVQASQGLNMWGEKATSMDDSLSIVANVTKDLVGINSGMLAALQNMQISLSGAAGSVAKNISSIAAPLPDTLPFGFDGALSFLNGSSSTVDEGIKIVGGQLNDMLNDVTVQAYNTINYKKWRYGSVHSKTAFENAGEEVNKQFSLAFNSIADAVMSGSTALGVSDKDAAAAIGASTIDDISISTRGMSTTEKTEAINNALSDVFNNLSSEVIPWLSDLQQAGEDLGTTLSRVSTQVSIADLMVERFGVTFGNKLANPEMYAKAADNLTKLVGGIEILTSSTSSFIDNFASDEIKLSIHTDALNDAFSSVGLVLPKTASGMWDLMEGLDGSTQAGAEQIATILKLNETSSEYYDMLNTQNEAMSDLSDSLAGTVLDIYDLSDGLSQVSLDAAVTAARFGDFSLAESLNLGDYKLSESDFSSAASFNIAQAEAANKLIELSELSAAASADVQTQQLDVLNSINESIRRSNQEMIAELRIQNELQANSEQYLQQIRDESVEA